MAKNKASINANSPRKKHTIIIKRTSIQKLPCKSCGGKKLKF